VDPSRFISRWSWISADLKKCRVRGVNRMGTSGLSRVYDDDLPNPFPNPRFNQQRHVHDTHPLSPDPSPNNSPNHRFPHSGVHDPIQPFPLPLVVEYHSPEFLPVQASVRLEYILSESLDDGGISVRSRENRFSGQ
jgi:hypothetical protein